MHEIYLIPSLMDSTQNYIFYLIDKETNISAIIDPGSAEPMISFLQNHPNLSQRKPQFIINTHHHWDHVNGNLTLKKLYQCQIVAGAKDAYRIPGVDIELDYNEHFKVGNIDFLIIHTPGHTKNHIALYSAKEKLLFCGDVMFSAGCGGLFEGTAAEMFTSFQFFNNLPNDTLVYSAHEYTASNLEFARYLDPNNADIKIRINQVKFLAQQSKPTLPSTILIEKKTNPFMRYADQKLRSALNLATEISDKEVFINLMNRKAYYYAQERNS